MKSKKTIESFVGKIIYGFLLFMPLLSILVKSMYVIFNDNAYKSYENNITSTETEINYKNLEQEKTYSFKYDTLTITNGTLRLNVENIKVPGYSLEGYNQFYLYRSNGNPTFSVMGQGLTTTYIAATNLIEGTFTYLGTNTTTNFESSIKFYETLENQTNTLENVFEYAIDQVENNSLYSWTQETAIYDVIHTMTTTIQVNSSFVDLLLTYWFLITIIYILFDIAFVMLMYVHDKIHGILEK